MAEDFDKMFKDHLQSLEELEKIVNDATQPLFFGKILGDKVRYCSSHKEAERKGAKIFRRRWGGYLWAKKRSRIETLGFLKEIGLVEADGKTPQTLLSEAKQKLNEILERSPNIQYGYDVYFSFEEFEKKGTKFYKLVPYKIIKDWD